MHRLTTRNAAVLLFSLLLGRTATLFRAASNMSQFLTETSLAIPQRLRLAALVVALAALALFAPVLLPASFAGSGYGLLLIGVAVALAGAIALHIRFLQLAGRDHCTVLHTLELTEREYQTIFETAQETILVFDDQGICIAANPAAFEIFGGPQDTLVGKALKPFFASRSEER